jgi:Protein of unknown function with HXXEE motif
MEKLLFLEEWAKEVFAGRSWKFFVRLYELSNLAVAMLLLTLTVSVVVWMEYKKRHCITLHCTVFCACLLLVNGIVHVGQFFLYSSYVPGLISAVLLMIPYMVYFLWLLAENRCISVKQIAKYLVISIVAMNPLIIIFLIISRLIIFPFM